MRTVVAKPGSGERLATSRSQALATAGVKSPQDYANLMSALMTDVLEGAVTPHQARVITKEADKRIHRFTAGDVAELAGRINRIPPELRTPARDKGFMSAFDINRYANPAPKRYRTTGWVKSMDLS